MKAPKILFFVQGMSPSPEDIAEAAEINAQVVFRNACAVPAQGSLETCDGVAGAVPEPYKKLPSAKEALAKHAASVKALKKTAGESPASDDPPPPPAAPTGEKTGEGESTPPPAPTGNAGGAWSRA